MRCIWSAARTARSASSSWATGALNRATIALPTILSMTPEGRDVSHEPFEAPVDEVLHVLGVGRLGEGGEPDQVGEQDGGDAALVGADHEE